MKLAITIIDCIGGVVTMAICVVLFGHGYLSLFVGLVVTTLQSVLYFAIRGGK